MLLCYEGECRDNVTIRVLLGVRLGVVELGLATSKENLLFMRCSVMQELMEHLVDSLGYLLKGHGPAYLNVFDTVTAPAFGPLLASSQPDTLR